MCWRVAELYCGIGGAAQALPAGAEVVAAVDINRKALAVYALNYRHPTWIRALESLPASELAALGADLWWLSPPCQPFTRRGLRRDDEDPRSQSLLALLPRLEQVRPPLLALENVPGFATSATRARLLTSLEGSGYELRERLLCPSELGVPNRRQRYYLLASRLGWSTPPNCTAEPRRLAAYLDPQPSPALDLDPAVAERFRFAIDVVDAADPTAVAATFTAAYGRSPVRSGSYLPTPRGLRRFSPHEILRLLGFADGFRLPPALDLEGGWRLLGNSLSVTAVRHLLRELPA